MLKNLFINWCLDWTSHEWIFSWVVKRLNWILQHSSWPKLSVFLGQGESKAVMVLKEKTNKFNKKKVSNYISCQWENKMEKMKKTQNFSTIFPCQWENKMGKNERKKTGTTKWRFSTIFPCQWEKNGKKNEEKASTTKKKGFQLYFHVNEKNYFSLSLTRLLTLSNSTVHNLLVSKMRLI